MGAFGTVEDYIKAHPKWENQLNLLREIIKSYSLTERIKWGAPVYELDGKNLFSLGAFKNHYAIWFFQGGLLRENTALLANTQDEKTKAMRQIRFTENSRIDKKELSRYIEESIKLHKEGKGIKIDFKREIHIPAELERIFQNDDDLKKEFFKLSPGKQREYTEHVSSAKQEVTKLKRIEKIIPLIKGGRGLNDKYRKS